MNVMQMDSAFRLGTSTGKIYSNSQNGVALVISLVLLLAMTILGVATLSGTRLNELIASNTQQKSIVFEAAESAIESVSSYDNLLGAITSGSNSIVDDPEPVTLEDTVVGLAQGYDLVKDGKGIDIDGIVTVQYCGETTPIGTNLNAEIDAGQFSAVLVDVNSQVGIANSNANADHLQRLSFTMLQTGRSGDCVVRN